MPSLIDTQEGYKKLNNNNNNNNNNNEDAIMMTREDIVKQVAYQMRIASCKHFCDRINPGFDNLTCHQAIHGCLLRTHDYDFYLDEEFLSMANAVVEFLRSKKLLYIVRE